MARRPILPSARVGQVARTLNPEACLGRVAERKGNSMKAAVYSETGGPEVFRYAEVPDPAVGPGAVLVRNEVISIEGGDVLHRAGGDLRHVPHIVGYQSAGVVEAVGADVSGFVPGDRVVTLGMDGSHAELRVVPEGSAWKIPDDLTTEDAAVVPVPFGTAHDALFEFGHLIAGETVLVTAGSGGVGTLRSNSPARSVPG